MKLKSLKFQIPFIILVFALSSILITVILLENVTSKHLKEDILNKNLAISEMIGEYIHLYLQNAKETVEDAAKITSEKYNDIETIKLELSRIYDNFQYFNLVFYVDNKGELFYSIPKNEDASTKFNYQDRDYYQQVMNNGKSYISHLYISRVLDELHFIIASPVFDNDKNVVGLIGCGIPLSNIEMLTKKGQANFDGKIYIVDQFETLVVHPYIESIKELNKMQDYPIVTKSMESSLANIMKKGKKTNLSYFKTDGNRYHSAISFVEEVNWMIIAEQSEEDILKETIWLSERLLIITVYLIGVVLLIGLTLANKITGPIDNLMKEVRKIGHDYSTIDFIEIKSSNEIGELSSTFNDMIIRLKENISSLNESYNRENYIREYLDNILKSLESGIIVTDEEGIITIVNKAAEQIIEVSKEKIVGGSIKSLFNKMNLNLDEMVSKIMSKTEQSIILERTIFIRENKEIPINISISPAIQANSEIIGIIYLFRDISEIKQIEEELNRIDRIHILGELSSALIHDIGNPLAGMSNLLELLNNNSEDEELSKEIFKMLNIEIDDLNDLVVNFLSFSRMSTLNKKETDIFNLVDEVINLLKPEIINKNIKLFKSYEDNKECIIKINRTDIKHAIINIIINCIQASKENGVINIIVTDCLDKVKIRIKDNGIGINQEDIGKIFEPFYTTKRDGTGLGLSTTYKIIKGHEGNISVSSQAGKGTQFDITLKR